MLPTGDMFFFFVCYSLCALHESALALPAAKGRDRCPAWLRRTLLVDRASTVRTDTFRTDGLLKICEDIRMSIASLTVYSLT
jgi:hypothetical protein